jgi:predicted N-acetyltransferase YhbS
MKIRQATDDDVPRISKMLCAAYGKLLRDDYPADILDASLPFMAEVSESLIDTRSYFVATKGHEIIAAGGWSTATPEGGCAQPGRANVRKVAVHPEHLRKGVGSALIEHTHLTALEAGHSWMHCLSSITAMPFYQSMGYRLGAEHFIQTSLPNRGFKSFEMHFEL